MPTASQLKAKGTTQYSSKSTRSGTNTSNTNPPQKRPDRIRDTPPEVAQSKIRQARASRAGLGLWVAGYGTSVALRSRAIGIQRARMTGATTIVGKIGRRPRRVKINSVYMGARRDNIALLKNQRLNGQHPYLRGLYNFNRKMQARAGQRGGQIDLHGLTDRTAIKGRAIIYHPNAAQRMALIGGGAVLGGVIVSGIITSRSTKRHSAVLKKHGIKRDITLQQAHKIIDYHKGKSPSSPRVNRKSTHTRITRSAPFRATTRFAQSNINRQARLKGKIKNARRNIRTRRDSKGRYAGSY